MEIPPIIHHEVSHFLENETSKIFELIEAFGSALHLIFPAIVEQNIRSYQQTLKDHDVEGSILYAAKANKSKAVLEMISKCGLGSDVSSLYELRHSLTHGIRGKDIGVSGSTKDLKLLLLALQHDCTIALDSIQDLQNLLNVKKAANIRSKAKILLRLNDVAGQTSRFGITTAELPGLYEILKLAGDNIDLKGFSFHIDGYSIEERTKAIIRLTGEIETARRLGFHCDTIDIGGGFTISYIDEESWREFNRALAKNPSQFFHDKQPEKFYPYYNENPKETFFKKILENRNQTAQSIAGLLKENDIRLIIEPGRSLLDQAGITLIKVKDLKTLASGEKIVVVEANINSLSEQWFNSDFIPDPKHLQASPSNQPDPVEAAVGGNTCLEIDMLSWRKIGFNK
jgi:diaminopimelate decarboxylase